MKKFFSRIVFVLLTGYIVAYYSEWTFWQGRPLSENFLLEAVPGWLAYSVLAWFLLLVLSYFRVNSIWAFFLAGAIYGWLDEGLLVQTMYDSFPLNLSWTGLAWHSLITVLFGLYYLPKALRSGKALIPVMLYSVALGLWSIGWWQETAVAPLESVFLYNGVFTLFLIPAYYFWLRYEIADFQPHRWGFALMLGLALLYYAFVTVPKQPIALVILPLCLANAIFALWKNRQQEAASQESASPVSLLALWPLLLIPFVSTLVYTLALTLGLALPTSLLLFFVAMPLGFIMFGLSCWKVV